MSLPDRVGVLGGGTMGAGIAHAFLLAGASVVVVERDEESAGVAKARVTRMIEQSIERGAEREVERGAERGAVRDVERGADLRLDEIARRLAASADVGSFGECGLVIEAVPEDFGLKAAALRRIEEVVTGGATIASNTSSISIDTLAGALERPERFLGMHFFNPVPASALVEIVLGSRTDDDAGNRAREWTTAIGKVPVTVRDSPGFVSSRLGVLLGIEAIRMLEEGVASAEDIDIAMTLGYKHPIGPLRLTDLVGLDVRLGIAEYLYEQLGERFRPPELLKQMVADGRLGRKSGRGFYDWNGEVPS